MAQYKQYEHDPNVRVPRSTSFYRRRASALEINDSDTDDENWRNPCLNDLIHNENDVEVSVDCNDVNQAVSPVCQLDSNLSSSSTEYISDQHSFEEQSSEPDYVQNEFASSTESERSSTSSMNDGYENDWPHEGSEREGSDGDDHILRNNTLEDILNLSYNENVFSHLKETLQKDVTNEIITTPLVVSQAEMFLGLVKYSTVYNIPSTGVANLFKVMNSFFASHVLPDTRYKIDKMFNCKNTVEYHSVCSNCKRYIKKFSEEDKEVRCSVCDTLISLKSPIYTDFFAIINVNNQISNFLEENSDCLQLVIDKRMQNVENECISDFMDGVLYKKFINSLSDYDKLNSITATFNSDGSPLFESSNFSVWPIQFILNEMPYDKRTGKSIVCGIWFGKDKPNMNIFLSPFIAYMNELSSDGVKCVIENEERIIKVFALCCCVDSVARAPMQGIHQFNGHYGCSWCLHPGLYVRYEKGGNMKYILLDDVSMRTEQNILSHMTKTLTSKSNVYGVKHPTALLLLDKFNVVSGFVPDNMHCINLGIAKQFLGYWMDTNGLPYSLNKDDIMIIEFHLQRIKAPTQITRLCRTLIDRKWWNARELENWVLYYSLPILKLFPRLKVYADHWERLVKAYHILLKTNISHEELRVSHELLKEFVILTEILYTHRAMTYNVHQLLHLAQSVLAWGPLWAHSGYCFENGNGILKNKVHAAKGVVQQICRAVSMDQCELILKRHVQDQNPDSPVLRSYSHLNCKETKRTLRTNEVRYFGKVRTTKSQWKEELQLSNNCMTYRKMVKYGCLYTSYRKQCLRSANCFAVTCTGVYIRIMDFLVDTQLEKEYAICNVIDIEDNDSPLKTVIDVSNILTPIETETIDRVCIFINFNDVMYICGVPNLHHY